MGYGVSACATCDGFFFKDRKLCVVGGGDTAMEEALFLTKFASEVHVVHRRDQLRASKIMAERAERNDKVHFIWNSAVDEIYGEPDAGGVTGVRLRDTGDDSVRDFACDGVFVAIGHQPNTSLFEGQLELDPTGYIVTKPKSTYTHVSGRVRLRRRAGSRVPPGHHRRRQRLHGGHRRGALARGSRELIAIETDSFSRRGVETQGSSVLTILYLQPSAWGLQWPLVV